MKTKIHMIATLLAMLPTMLFGGSYYYGALRTEISSASTGSGSVYAGVGNTAGTYGNDSQTPATQSSSKSESSPVSISGFKAYATTDATSYFVGWSETVSGDIVSSDSPYSVTVSSTSTDQNNPTIKTVYAHFKKIYTVYLDIPTVSSGFLSHTVSGEGISGGSKTASERITVSAYEDKNYTFTCSLRDTRVYKFSGWDIGGTTVSEDNPYSTKFSANTTIKAVVDEKAHATVTLAAPVGGSASYAVSGDKGFDGAGLGVGDNFKAYYDEKYTFTCNIADSNYELARWEITENGTTTTRDTATLEWTFTPDVATTVRAVLNRKAEYQLTLSAKPVGVLSYDVSGPDGADGLSSNGGGSMSFLGASDFTFSCTVDPAYKFDGWDVTDSSGTTTHYSELVLEKRFADTVTVTPQVSLKATYELTFDMPEQVTSFSIIGPNEPVPISSEGKATVYELDEYQITCVFDEENWELVKWTITDTSGTTEPTTETLNNKTFTSDARVTVTLNKVEAFIATCLTVPSGCSYKVGNTTVNTTEQKVRGEKGQPLTVILSAATAGSGYVFAGWYIENQDGSKNYISNDASVTQTFNSHVRLGADFVSSSSSKTARVIKGSGGYAEYDDLNDAFRGLGAGDSITIYKSATLSQNAVLSLDASLTISQGVTVTIAAGTTLMIAGTVTNNGAISGSGIVAKNYKTAVQSSTINVPFPYGTDGVETGNGVDGTDGTAGKYVKTSLSAGASLTGCSCTTKWFATVMSSDGTPLMSPNLLTSTPIAVKCKANRKKALNYVTEVVKAYDNIETAILDSLFGANYVDNEYMLVLFDDCTDVLSVKYPSSSATTGFALDCAGRSISFKPKQFGSAYLMRFFNGSVTFSVKSMAPHINFYGCSKASLSNISVKYTCGISLYDSAENFSIYCSETSSIVDGASLNFYGGGPYTVPSQASKGNISLPSGGNFTKVYWGTFKSDPTGFLAYKNRYRAVPLSGTSYYVVERYSGNAAHAFKIGSVEKDTLEEAFAVAGNGDTIVLQKDYELTENVIVPVGLNATLDLSGWTINGVGTLINKGNLDIADYSGSVEPGIIETPIVCESGNLYFSIVTCQNTVTAKGGKCRFLSGSFNGNVAVDGAIANPVEVAEISGGTFLSNTYLHGGELCSILELCPGGRCGGKVGEYKLVKIPVAYLSGSSPYSIVAFDPNTNDQQLYTKSLSDKKRNAYSDAADWARALELNTQSTFFNKWGIDCTIVFDRKVASSNITATAASYNITLDSEAKANEVKSVLLPKLREISQSGSTQWGNFGPWTYGSFLPGGDHANQISMSISNSQTTNNGTSCRLQMRLAENIRWMSGKKDWSYDIANGSVVIAEKYFVIGAGSNKAMIRPDVGEATFYATLASALTAVANNGTVMLANDCAENVTVGKECTIMVNGFNFTGSVTAADGYQVAFADGVYVVTKLGPAHPADYVVIPSEHLTEWESDNGITTGSTESEIRDALKLEDENGIAKWENVVLGQEGTHKPAIETSTNGTETVADMVLSFKVPENTGYTVKYAFDKVDNSGSVVANGEGEPQANPQLDLTQVSTAGTPAYFKMRAVLESNDEKHTFTTNVPVDHTVGVLKVNSSTAYTILAVPWKSFHDTDVNVAELVHAASLSEDDMLSAYDNEGNLESWRVSNGVWVKMTEVQGQQVVTSDDPANFGVARGKGVWLKRSDTSKPIYLMGMPPASDDTASTTLTAPASGETSWNLLASPKLKSVNFDKFNTGDEIIVPTAGTPKHYTYKNNAWGYPGATTTEVKTLPNGTKVTVIKTEHKTDDTTIAPGTGFWYLNKGGQKTIEW